MLKMKVERLPSRGGLRSEVARPSRVSRLLRVTRWVSLQPAHPAAMFPVSPKLSRLCPLFSLLCHA